MARVTEWQFLDDRGRMVAVGNRPVRLVAYVQAGAALFDHGIRPVGVFGSHHDGDTVDPAKAGALPRDEIAYLGSGAAVDAEAVLRTRPDLLVAVTYGSDQVYGLDRDTAKHIEERVPVVVLDVGQGRSLDDVRERFAALARSLGAQDDPAAVAELAGARQRLRSAAAEAGGARVLALSPAAPDSVHLARPHTWPDLRALAECGVALVAPEAGPGVNWSTVDRASAARLEAEIVLTDVRVNALSLDGPTAVELRRALAARARIVPWNPELAPGPAAHAAFFDTVAGALRAVAASPS
ncbi:ABC transporter substrate-binding protein [Streptomyces sp. NPDC006208]|uniref:ABC transporter substrate-binding protein n=1 Tax=Streptomyces sp. NPDC006208 TaxID=3156734 RepID=UPI0033A9FAE7